MTPTNTFPKVIRAIICIVAKSQNTLRINYSRRMYAIIRRYTPEVAEGVTNQCFAELTGLRTFYKMTYTEMAESILKDLKQEIGISFSIRMATTIEFEQASSKSKKSKNVSTYKEINKLFAGMTLATLKNRHVVKSSHSAKKVRLTVPYLGKVQ